MCALVPTTRALLRLDSGRLRLTRAAVLAGHPHTPHAAMAITTTRAAALLLAACVAALAVPARAATCPAQGVASGGTCYSGSVLTKPPTVVPAGLCGCSCSDGLIKETAASSSSACTTALCGTALSGECTSPNTWQSASYQTWSAYVASNFGPPVNSTAQDAAGNLCVSFLFSCTQAGVAAGVCDSWSSGSVQTLYTILDLATCTTFAPTVTTAPYNLVYGYFYACNTTGCNAPGSGPQPSAARATPAAAATAALVAAAAALALW